MVSKEILFRKQVTINSLETQVIKLLNEPLINLSTYEFKIEHSRTSPIRVNFRFLSSNGHVSQDYSQSDIENGVPFFIKSERVDEDAVFNKLELEGNYDPFVIAVSIKKISLNLFVP